MNTLYIFSVKLIAVSANPAQYTWCNSVHVCRIEPMSKTMGHVHFSIFGDIRDTGT